MIAPPFDEWVESIFRRPVTEDGWWWDKSQPRPLDPKRAPEQALELVTRLFGTPGEVSRFTDQELGQGFWFLFDFTASSYLDLVRSERLPGHARARCVTSIFELNRDLIAPRCADALEGSGRWSLNTTAYMLWDLNDALGPHPEDVATDGACLGAMARTLELDSAVCQRSALHGLGHWAYGYPELVTRTIDAFLTREGIAPAVREYAARARTGDVA